MEQDEGGRDRVSELEALLYRAGQEIYDLDSLVQDDRGVGPWVKPEILTEIEQALGRSFESDD